MGDFDSNDESSSQSELKVKLNDDNSTSLNDWSKNRLDDYSSSKTLSPSAVSSDASSVHSTRFDTDFSVGQRIEVEDYRTQTWYTAKIVEVDYDDKEIFIHYERWSQRFDEWLKWDSQRIRRIRLPPSNHRFKVGEHVLATWSYTKKYPAVVKSLIPDDKYEVLFYDGFAKILKDNRISKIDPKKINLLEKMPKEIPRAPPIGSDLDVRNIGTKEERRQKKRRLNVVELLQSNKRRRLDDALSSQSCSDTSPETPSRRHQRRQYRQATKPKLASSSASKSSEGTVYRKRNAINNINAKEDEESENSKQNHTDDGKNDLKDDLEKVKEVSLSNVTNDSIIKPEIVIKEEPDSKTSEISYTSSVKKTIKSEDNEEVNNKEKDKDSNSEQEFVGFEPESSSVIIQSVVKEEKPPVSQSDVTKKLPRKIIQSSVPIVGTPLGRRISKRGRIPKMKTSLGNLGTSPRLSTFPKIKPRGRIYNDEENDRGKKNKNTRGKIKNKRSSGTNCLNSTDVVSSDSHSKIVKAEDIKDELICEQDQSDQSKNSNEKPIAAKIDKQDTNICANVQVDSNIDNKTLNLLKESENITVSNNIVNENPASTRLNINKLDNGVHNQDSVLTNNELITNNASAPFPMKKRGRRVKKALKKLDIKKGKSWKIMSRRKADDDEDPERWSGDIPEGAKPVFIDGGDGKMRQSIIIPDKKLPTGWTKHTIIRKNSSKWDVLLVNPNGRKFRSRKDLRTYYSEMNKDYPEDCFDFVVGRTKATTNLIEMETKKQGLSPPSLKTPTRKKEFKKSESDDSFASLSPSLVSTPPDGEKRVKTLMPKTKPTMVSNEDESIVSAAAAAAAVSAVTTNSSLFGSSSNSSLQNSVQHFQNINKPPAITSLAMKSSLDMLPASVVGGMSASDSGDGTASWQCPKDGCGKHFRKENLLQMHIKHYHPEYNQFLDGAPNVADLAYARTVGEPLDETVGAASFLDRISKYEARRKAKADTGGSSSAFNKKTIISSSPNLRKALLKGLPKDSMDFSDENNDFLTKMDSSSMGGKSFDSLDNGDSVDGVFERTYDTNEKGKYEDHEGDYNQISNNHSTLKELLTGGVSLDESAPNSPLTPTGIRNGCSQMPYRFSRNKPLINLDKLNVTTDSNDSVPDMADQELMDVTNCAENEQDDLLKKEEIINCLCGYAEEDGLMIQCDLCLCWQHGFCNSIKKESDVPEKYVCSICRNPKKLRNSYKYSFNSDWLKEGKLPTLSVRNPNVNEIVQRESLLKQSHDLVSTLLELQKVVKSLRLKTHIAGKSDHPKLYLWAKSWEREGKQDVVKNEDKDIKTDVGVKKEIPEEVRKEKQEVIEDNTPKGPQAPVPEAPIDLVECRLRLLEHIEDYQQQVESRLTTLEAQVAGLESQDPDLATDETPDFYPQTKQTVQMLTRDLMTVRKVIGLN